MYSMTMTYGPEEREHFTGTRSECAARFALARREPLSVTIRSITCQAAEAELRAALRKG